MAQQPKRIGLIGLSAGGSWASRAHLPYLTSTPHYTITALQNSSEKSAEIAAKQYNLNNVSTHANPESLAADQDIDIVAVSVKVPHHYSLIKPALLAQKDVFVEWPLGRTLPEAVELTSLAKEKGVRTLVGLQARQNPSIIKAREIVKSGRLGKILGTSMYAHAMGLGASITEHQTYIVDIENGANVLTIPFGHAVDALCYVLGEIDSLSATLANNIPETSVLDKDGKELRKQKKTSHDYVSITGTLANGGVVDATYVAGVSRTGRNFYWEINGSDASLVLEGANGHVQMFQPTVKLYTGEAPGMQVGGGQGKGVHVEEVEVEKAGDFSFNVGKAWDAWAGVGLEDGCSVTSFEDALVRHRMIDAIYQSAEKGTREGYL